MLGKHVRSHGFAAGEGLLALVAVAYTHAHLIFELTRRDLKDRFSGQALGTFWALLQPAFLMAVYALLFAYVFPARFADGQGASRDFSINILAGVIPWLTFQEVLGRSSSVIVGSASLVKQIVFPVEVLSIKTVLASSFSQIVTLSILIVLCAARGEMRWSWVLVPFLFAFQILAMVGVCYALAAIGAYFRDIREFVQLLCTVNLFAQPILYDPDRTPAVLGMLLQANPFSYMVWAYQDAIYSGRFDHPLAWVVFPIGSLVVLIAGFRIFKRLQIGFGNVL